MSGPKRADVEAALDMITRSLQGCAGRIARSQDAAVAALAKEIEVGLRDVDGGAQELRRALRGLPDDLRQAAPDATRAAEAAVADVERAATESRTALGTARALVERARALEAEARGLLERAEQEQKKALAALRAAGSHYLHGEMQQAQAAQALVAQATGKLAQAEQARTEAERVAREGLMAATEARVAAEGARERVRLARSEAESRKRAREEALRIAEQKRREAVLAVDGARSALARIEGLPHAKFRPGELDRLRAGLSALEGGLARGGFDEAVAGAGRLVAEAGPMEASVLQASREFERRKAEAGAQVSGLKAAFDGVDEALVRDWGDDAGAVGKARQAHEAAGRALAGERFDEAVRLAEQAREAVAAAMKGAAEAKAAHERREQIGDAVMDALGGLGFDVSFEPGNRTEPLRISGQTADERGRGDFDIAIPLSGDVGFHLDTPEGDASCVAAVEELQKRLAEKGIAWRTTDWGHATGAGTGRSILKGQQKQTEKAKGKA